MTELLFSYGTLQQEEVQRASFGRKLEGMSDALPGWKQEMVEITDPDVLAKSGKRFHPIVMPGGAGDQVPGTCSRSVPRNWPPPTAMKSPIISAWR